MITAISGDTSRLRATADFVKAQDTATLLPLLLPGLDGPELRSLAERCTFSHAALLVFPPDEAALNATLTDCGLVADAPPQASVVVRERLAVRHQRPTADLAVSILRPAVECLDGTRRMVEVFVLPVEPGSDLDAVAAHEREQQHEAHVAFEVEAPDPLVLRGLCAAFGRYGATPDGGGYNPHENGTVFYFTAPAEAKAGYRRVELYVPGDHRDLLAAHLDEHRKSQPAETLLRQLTGAWTTQALAAFARLGVADAMSMERGVEVSQLAAEVGAFAPNLTTLLRYLTMLGAVSEEGDRFRLTGTGRLLRTDTEGSMRPLALMYGGPFYESFAGLDHTVRTGEVAFEQRFGENHFDHFARDPELAELFDLSMAAGARMFDPLPTHPVLTEATEGATVVDIAGGNGELLGRILSAHPRLQGALLERPQTVETARHLLAEAGHSERCTFHPGDFADVPAGGDVYVLSRVLHDWDDDRCLEILRHCARAMPDTADLLVVERVLPADGSPSLATAWDLHMMCNVGGRERRADHYARLFADAGLTLVGVTPLPLDGNVLHVRRGAGALAP
ncbi:methyltransferase [Streptomyces sp. NBC_01465]|uniref:methyltransferase n=1 Tax=Streptomyces sp. NBC_01465 TaxID=2903878 RepID=UPI002E327362|nr:methyltransferase [Streptomyces sp. NBC_01465]